MFKFRYLLPASLCIALSGCYVYAYPPDEQQPAQQVQPAPQYYTGGVVPPNYTPPSIKVNPQHSTGYKPPITNVNPPVSNVTPHHATGFNPPSKPIQPASQQVQPAAKPVKKTNPASASSLNSNN